MLDLRKVNAGYGRIGVLRNVELSVNTGEIVALVGANGAGKTTLLMTICGCVRAQSGDITFDNRNITGLPTFEIARLGIAHVPEGRRIFSRMSVLENLQMGALVASQKHFDDDLGFVLDLLPHLKDRLHRRGGTLSGGEQQMLAIGRALMARPKLLLLDEPSLGLAPLMTRQVFSIIGKINRERAMTILLIEQNAFQALNLAARGYVMVGGAITQSGASDALLADPAVQRAYLEGVGASTGA